MLCCTDSNSWQHGLIGTALVRLVAVLVIAVGALSGMPGSALAAGDEARQFRGNPSVDIAPPRSTQTSAHQKIGHDLDDLAQEYEDFEAKVGRAGGEFHSTREHLRVTADGFVLIHAVASGDPAALRADLEALGMRNVAVSGRLVSGQMPIKSLRQSATMRSLQLARPAIPRTNVGKVTSEGDSAMKADLARVSAGVDGTGITVGVMSDSFNCLGGAAADVTSGDLPASGVTVLSEGPCGTAADEGRAMAQIVHDVAPGAAILFHSAFNGEADFAAGIAALKAAGANVIVDDVNYVDEPYFQDGVVAQAAEKAVAQGASYFGAAGNYARNSYESPFQNSGQTVLVAGRTCTLHDFNSGGAVVAPVTLQSITIPGNWTARLALQWDEPYFSVSGPPGSANDLDLLLFDATGKVLLASSTTLNVGRDPFEFLTWTNIGSSPITAKVAIALCGGAAPGLIKYVVIDHNGFGTEILDHATHSSTIVPHANGAGVAAVGAAFWNNTPAFGTTQAVNESFSSAGGSPILFDIAGARLGAPQLRSKPEIVGPDGVLTTFFPAPCTSCRFYGTSAAAPHVAAVAALLLSKNPTMTPARIVTALEDSAVTMADTAVPLTVPGMSNGVAAVATGGRHSCALTTAGGVQCWGSNSNGQLGNNTTLQSTQPVAVTGLGSGVTAITAGSAHTCALASTGGVQCWGYNAAGQLGNGTLVAGTNSLTPVPVSGLSSGIAAVAAGYAHTCALASTGGVQCWGYNAFGQLGNGTSGAGTDSLTPVPVPALSSGVLAISAGLYHTCALITGGAVKCWGYNLIGQLGNGGTVDSSVPVPVTGLSSGVTQLAAGGYHACALTVSGAPACWGYNVVGQLGNGGTVSSSVPVLVTGLSSGVTRLACGGYHTCALTASGAAECWGYDATGQIGSGNGGDSHVPVEVWGLGGGMASVGAGLDQTCAVTSTGAAKCWGLNAFGQVGASPAINAVTGHGFVQADAAINTITAAKTNQSITFGTAPVLKVGGTGTVTAAASSGLPVAFTSLTLTTCTISGSLVTGVAAGTCAIAANQAGNGSFNAAPQATQNIAVAAAAARGLSPASLTFASQLVGSTSPAQVVTLSNAGTTNLTVGTISTTAGFTHPATTCQTALAAGASCTVNVAFAPTTTGVVTGALTVGANGAVTLTGSGVAPAAGLSPANFAFGNQQLRTASAPASFTYANTGLIALTVSAVTIRGLNSADFAIARNGCAAVTLQPAASCTITVAFRPASLGTRSARLSVVDTAAATQRANMTGTGVAPAINFGAGTFQYGTVTAVTAATFTLSNTGTAPFVIGNIRLTNGTHYVITGGTCAVGNSVANSSACTVVVAFAPSGTSVFSDTLTVSGAGVGTGAPTYTASRALTGN